MKRAPRVRWGSVPNKCLLTHMVLVFKLEKDASFLCMDTVLAWTHGLQVEQQRILDTLAPRSHAPMEDRAIRGHPGSKAKICFTF